MTSFMLYIYIYIFIYQSSIHLAKSFSVEIIQKLIAALHNCSIRNISSIALRKSRINYYRYW